MPDSNRNSKIDIPETNVRGTLRDFILPIVELLGILVPGVIFIFAFIPTVIIPLTIFIQTVKRVSIKLPLPSEKILIHFISPNFGTLFIISIFSYVVGHLFFRQDPKIPDEYSFQKVKKTINEEGPVRLSKNEQQHNEKNELPNKHNLEFPYRYLKEYLLDRGMEHLANMIPWSGNNPETYNLRTKHFINILKIRLEFLFPHQYLRIQRNEAHVRLMSSMWYAAKSLIYTGVIGLIIGVISVILFVTSNPSVWPSSYVSCVVLPVIVMVLMIKLKNHIESFLHYQRIREVVFILEMAYFAQKIYPNLNFLEELTIKKSTDRDRDAHH